MSKWILAAGAAAIALATPALADPGGNKGKSGDDRGPKAAKVERGGGDVRMATRTERPEKREREVKVRERSDERVADKADRAPDVRGKDRAERRGDDRLAERGNDRSKQNRDVERDRDSNDDRFFARNDNARDGRGLVNGCPPGLAKKNNGCLPPGQARKLVGSVLPAAFGANLLDGPFRQWYRDNDRFYYRNDGDNIYRVNREGGLIDALMPYGSRDFAYYPVGTNYPGDYDFYNVPDQYRSLYADGSDYDYRFGNNAIYQVDPQTNAIQSIVALLAGDLSVGQQMPNNYSMYNVPLQYRDRYYDSPDASYRYNDGYIYRADPKTQLITAVIDAII